MRIVTLQKFIERQITQIRDGGRAILVKKLQRTICLPPQLSLAILVTPFVLLIRLIRPWLLVRWGGLASPRIGHFAGNTELYLCERDAGINVPLQRHLDVFFMEQPICNVQLAKMWRRVLLVWPGWWVLPSIQRINQLIPGGALHEIGENAHADRDVHNLLDRYPPHLKFTVEEEVRGEAGLLKIGIPSGTPFVCLIVRDSAYLDAHQPKDWSYHNYRDSDIGNYVLVAETLAGRGYAVIRMGVKVCHPLESKHPLVIDYATNGMRSDFMDIYLGAKCAFCISTSTGFDAVPIIFRRPTVFVNLVPLGYFRASSLATIGIFKHHISVKNNKKLYVKDIFDRGVGFSLQTADYAKNDILLVENTPEEIRDVAIEMAERLSGTWQECPDDVVLQTQFWETFPAKAKDTYHNRPLHGDIHARIGAQFIRNNYSRIAVINTVQ